MVATTADPTLLDGAATDVDDDLLAGPAWSRHPTDVARVVVTGVALVVALLLCLRRPTEVRSVSVDVVRLVSQLPSWLRLVLIGLTQLYMIAAAVALVVVFSRRRARLFAMGVVAAGVGSGLMALAQSRVDAAVPNQVVRVNLQTSWLVGAAFPSGAFLAGFVAATVVLGPTISVGWRRVLTATIALAGMLRILTAVVVPLNLAVTIALGYLVGSAVLAVVGSPRRTVSRRVLLAGLHSIGFPVTEVEAVDAAAHHSRTFVAHDERGRQVLVKLTGRDERDAYVLQRAIRSLRVKGLEDQIPHWSVGDSCRHEALTAAMLRRGGAEVSDVVGVGETDGGDGIVVLAPSRGRLLRDVPAGLVTNDVLDAIWAQVRTVRDRGVAHRWLTADHLLVDIEGATDELAWEPRRPDRPDRPDDGPDPHGSPAGDADGAHGSPAGGPGSDDRPAVRVTVIDFRWSAQQAEPHLLGADVAMLVTSLALHVGVERSVAAATRALTRAELIEALPLVQLLALPAPLQREVRAHDDGPEVLASIRSSLQAAADDAGYELLDLKRLKLSQVLTVVGGVLAAYTFLSFASSWSHIRAALAGVSPADLPLLVFLALVSYPIGAGILRSVVTRPLPFGQVVELMFGQSFLNRFTPANSGGMALRVRYLQKRGVDLPSAATAIALTSVASGIAQAVVLLTFAVWAGSSADGVGFSLPDANLAALALVAVLCLAGLVWLTPWGRRLVREKVVTSVRTVWTTLTRLMTQPGRFVNLFGLTILTKFLTILTFTQCARALEVSVSFPRLGLLYLTASSVASAAPTPGGVGAVEAALAAALTGSGVEPTQALSTVFLFRLLSYWLPVPVGYLALVRIRRILAD